MGYRFQPKIYNLKFEDHEGLEVIARSVNVDELLEVLKMADSIQTAKTDDAIDGLFGWFVKRLVGWNLEDEDGKPVAKTVKALRSAVDLDFAFMIVMAWVQALTGVKVPTVAAGQPGTPPDPVEVSIPMSPPAGTLSRRG